MPFRIPLRWANKMSESARSREYKNSYVLLSQEVAHMDHSVRAHIVQQIPLSSPVHLWPNIPDMLQQPFQIFHTDSLTLQKEFLWIMPLHI